MEILISPPKNKPRKTILSQTNPLANSRQYIKAKYDAAQTTDDNIKHWAESDSCSPDYANSPCIRDVLRRRARYEVANNCYAKGMVKTLADDVIGTGPRLQMHTDNPELNAQIEKDFTSWSRKIKFAKKLRTMRKARCVDGEAFAILFTNPKIKHAVKLDLKLVEAERVCDPYINTTADPLNIDGIVLDEFGNPTKYYVLNYHPGDGWYFSSKIDDYTPVNAESVIHTFVQDRPEQHRGVSEILPALPLLPYTRRFTLATVSAAEAAACQGGILYSDAPPSTDEDVQPEAMDKIYLERNLFTTVPGGWKLGQLKAEHPNAQYSEFKREQISETARPLSMPLNVAACDSSRYNYASGRLDHQIYNNSNKIDQDDTEIDVLDRVLEAFFNEYMYTNTGVFDIDIEDHEWHWPGKGDIDPETEAKAAEIRLRTMTRSYAAEYASQGKDWETEFQQIANEKNRMKELGITVEDVTNQRNKVINQAKEGV
jgi:lambda family phage portal protein